MTVAALAAKADVLSIYTSDYLSTCFTDGVIDDDKLEKALQSATEELYTYLGGRVELPDPVPAFVIRHVINMGLYALSPSADVMSSDKARLHKEALDWAKDYRKNTRSAGASTGADAQVPTPAKAHIISSRITDERTMTREGLDSLF